MTCVLHTEGVKDEVRARGLEARRSASADKKRRQEERKLSTKERLARRLESEAEAVEARIVALALSSTDEVAIRGLQLWLDRVLGRPLQQSETNVTHVDLSVGHHILEEIRRSFDVPQGAIIDAEAQELSPEALPAPLST